MRACIRKGQLYCKVGKTDWGKSYYKVGQEIYYEVGQSLLQSGAGITKWGKYIARWGSYYEKVLYTLVTLGQMETHVCLLIRPMRFEGGVL